MHTSATCLQTHLCLRFAQFLPFPCIVVFLEWLISLFLGLEQESRYDKSVAMFLATHEVKSEVLATGIVPWVLLISLVPTNDAFLPGSTLNLAVVP